LKAHALYYSILISFVTKIIVYRLVMALIVSNMTNKMLTWAEIKEQYPELAERLKNGDMEARIEFVRLSFNATIISDK
jgi:hypothetical protein